MTTPSGSVAVLGSFMMDMVVEVARRPERGETVVGTGFEVFLGGKGCNQAIAAARLGATTAMVGRVGADDFGRRFLDQLAHDGIDTTHVVVDTLEGTGVGAPVVEHGGENSIVIVPRANGRVTPADVEAALPALTSASVLLLQLELPLDTVLAAARHAKDAGVTVILNPAPALPDLTAFAGLIDVLVPNEVEAAALVGVADPLEAATRLRRDLSTDVVVTVGGAGTWVVDDGTPELLPAHAVEVVDTVGAGDAFCGALGARLAAGASLREAAAFANAAAAVAVTTRGAEPAMPTAAAVRRLLQAAPTLSH
jgi:ribokinase